MNPFLEKIRIYILIKLSFLFYPIFAGLIYLRSKKEKKDKLRILIIPQLTRIGDLVCVTPIFNAIKEKYPDSFLAVTVTSKISGIIKNNPRIDEIIILEDSEYLDFFGLLRFFKKIRERKFDWSFCISASTLGTLIAFWGLAANRAKIIRQRRSFSEFLSDWINDCHLEYKGNEYLPEFYLEILKFINIEKPKEIKKEVFVSKAGEEKVEKFLKEKNINDKDLIIGISTTAGNKIKEWPRERFEELAKKLIEKYNAKIIFLDPKDFSLEELPSLMKRLNLFIAADSGPIHIAHALGVPLIDIIGPVDPSEQAPKGENCVIVGPEEGIKPTIFAMKPSGDLQEAQRAIESIAVEKVLEAVIKLLTKINKNAMY